MATVGIKGLRKRTSLPSSRKHLLSSDVKLAVAVKAT